MSQQEVKKMHTLQYVPVWGHSSQFQMAKVESSHPNDMFKKYILNQKNVLQDKK